MALKPAPPKQKKYPHTIYFSDEQRNRLDSLCEHYNMRRSRLIGELVDELYTKISNEENPDADDSL